MQPVILFRSSLVEDYEVEAAKKYFPVYFQRTHIPANSLVIPRYSALPCYQELEADVQYLHSKLINTYKEHCYVADLRNWYHHLADYTPRTWFYLDQLPEQGPFVIKGATNSKKHCWNTQMFCNNKQDAIQKACLLATDKYIGVQPIYARQYVPLRKLCDGLQGLPISEEYRFFVYNKQVLSGAFYWSSHSEDLQLDFDLTTYKVPQDWLNQIIDIVSPNIPFFVIDVAMTETGEWIVIELNDGQQSGLSDNDPNTLYLNLSTALR